MKFKTVRRRLLAFGIIIVSTFLTDVCLSLAAQNNTVCSSIPNINPLVKGRSKSITFPDGRTLTGVGHLHGDRQIYQISDLIDNGQLVTMSDEEFNQMLVKIADENRRPYQGMITRQDKSRFVSAIRTKYGIDISNTVHPETGFDLPVMTVENHAREDFAYLSQTLARPHNRISFVGYEGTQEAWSNNFPYYLRARRELLRQFYLRQGSGKIKFTQDQIEQLILSASNGSVYAYMRNPEHNKTVPMFGTEDLAAGTESERVDALQLMRDALLEVRKADDDYWKTKSENEKQAFSSNPANIANGALLMHTYSEVQNMNISSYAELDALISELREKSPVWLFSSLENLFRSLRERVRINFARDAASARNLAGRYESGIHFVGLNHFNNTMSNLENLCRRELNRTSNTMTSRPAAAVR